MSKRVEIELNLAGINEMMKSPEICSVLQSAGDSVAAAAGAGYTASTRTINWIGITNVYPDTEEAARDNFKHNSLLKAIGSVGLRTSK